MRVEFLIYIYGAVCLSMILFNCACIIMFKGSDKRLSRKSSTLDQEMERQFARMEQGDNIEDAHISYLNRKLRRVGNLMAFDAVLTNLAQNDEETARAYIHQIRSVFLYLSAKYLRKETVQSAYFAYLLSKHQVCRNMPFDAVSDMLQEYLKKDNLYCRQNAMNALYRSGDEMYVAEAVKRLDKDHRFFHSKILSDGLLGFTGEHEKLIALFWNSLDEFSVETQVAILNYVRFKTGSYCREMMEILTDESRDSELHYAAIRYFGRYHYTPALPILLKFVGDTDKLRWSYAAFSATSLANYPGKVTLEALKQALSSSNWYIRYNAAQSIEQMGVSYQDLLDVIEGNDRYAREMIHYRFDYRQLKEQDEEDWQL